MNVFDFDNTIYDGDSTIDFYCFCIKRSPWLISFLPLQICGALMYFLNVIDKTQFKELFFTFLKGVRCVDQELDAFWNLNDYKIKNWYIQIKKEDDVIVSASPEFLLKEICKRLGIENLIASRVEKKTGRYEGSNCSGIEKVNRFCILFDEKQIDNFYSDSKSDLPMARISKHAYYVHKKHIYEWKK